MSKRDRKNYKFIIFRGKKVKYTDVRDLSKKLNVRERAAQKLIKDSGRRLVIKDNGEVDVIDIKTDNVDGLLAREFQIHNVTNTQLINGADFPEQETEIINDKLSPNEYVKRINIYIEIYLNFGSPELLTIQSLKDRDGNIDKNLIQYYISTGSLVKRTRAINYSGEIRDIKNRVNQAIAEYSGNRKIRNFGHVVYSRFRLGSTFQNKKLHYDDGYIRDFENEYELTEWINIQYNYRNKHGDSCVVAYIKTKFPDLYWKIKKYETPEGIQLKNFKQFCETYSIGYNIYDETGKIISQKNGETGVIFCIIYNNHLYPLYGGKPKRYSCKEYKIHLINNANQMFEKLLKKKKLPSNIKINSIISSNAIEQDINDNIEELEIINNGEVIPIKHKNKSIDIVSFTVKNDKYINNPEYSKCKKILENIKLVEYIYDNIKITDISKLLEKIYKVNNTSSFFPEKYLFKTPPLYYGIKDVNKNRKISTIDKNKCYPYALYSLPYLITFDWRKNKVRANPTIINEQYLYIAKPLKFTILMPCTKLYTGYFLKDCMEIGIQFELLEELETAIQPNHYRKIIRTMFSNMEEKDFKMAMVILIGKFERSIQEQYTYKYTGTYNEESSKMYNGFTEQIGDHTIFFKENKQIKYARDKIPLATQIKDMSRFLVYKKIKELKLKDSDIIQINTDSISYYGDLPKGLNSKTFDGWKEAEYKPIGDIDVNSMYEANNEYPPTLLNLHNDNKNTRILHMKYAGSGKTTYIINELVPRLNKIIAQQIMQNKIITGYNKINELTQDKSYVPMKLHKILTYIVLTPTHSMLDEYKNANIPCEIIHKYTFSDTIPDEQYIIIDEIGFIDLSCHDFLYKLNHKNKSFECFGDFNQLLPIGEDVPCNQQHYLNFMFDTIDTNFINYRNNFTSEYYDDLINEKIDIVKEVNKYSTPIEKAEVVICYRTHKSTVSKTRDIYNEKILKQLGKKADDIGVKIICTNNKLKDRGIYNHKRLTIIDRIIEDEQLKYKLKDNTNEEFLISEREMRYFRPAYAINVYEAQGMTLESYHWAKEDNKFLYGNMAYTIISRIKQKK